ncbi:nucleotidyltransferase domain-containing protein [Glycomyces xiaoerkulensis]|uniref:nucleotidyltransferase domain-containing protein n=1 Tax=Glycomyces xiaoerkulensis TaxID=2038139 RepID=UPI000C26A886|nr:nucleotidyltransferase domain-containing protein [Glycomyces xiaoerkulensis]
MPDLAKLTEDAVEIGRVVLPECGYAIVYGSQATGIGSPTSDLDLLYVVGTDLPEQTKQYLAQAVTDLHRRHRLRLDNEVAHEVKLTATATELSAAVSLVPFSGPDQAKLRVPVVIPTDAYLNSREFKFRLILGALTGPHLFLSGHLHRYRRDQHAAVRAIAVLASVMLAHKQTITCDDIRSALLVHSSGAAGKDHLGYQPGAHLEHLARSIVAELLGLGVLSQVGGEVYKHRRPATGNLLAWPAPTGSI